MRIALLSALLLFCSALSPAQAQTGLLNNTGLDPLLPDQYVCIPDMCNRCNYRINKIGPAFTIEDQGCTEMGCGLPQDPVEAKALQTEYDQCKADWRYSKNIQYDDQPVFVNACINGFKNKTYWEFTEIRENTKHYAFAECLRANGGHTASKMCQDGYKNHFPDPKEVREKHIRLALARGKKDCALFYKDMTERQGFSDAKMTYFGKFLESRHLPPAHATGKIDGKDVPWRTTQKEVFDFLHQNNKLQITSIVSPLIYDDFVKQYEAALAAEQSTPQ